MKKKFVSQRIAILSLVLSMFILPAAVYSQTAVKLPKNKYKATDDIKLGNDAARQVDQQFPILQDRDATAYITRVGNNLVASIPSEFRQNGFDYRFKVVNASDINAFALPGGPMYVNRGMIEAAKNEGEMAGVMAHEISHVALRHATAQQTKLSNPLNQILGIGAVLGGYVLGGQTGAQLGQVFASGYFLKYSREYETQADILGARIMADAGYDPRDLANMFQTISSQGGGRSPEWLSSHPDPGNRYEKINREALLLRVSRDPIKITRDFERVQANLRRLPPARTMAQIQKDVENNPNASNNPTANGRYTSNVAYPSSRVRSYNAGGLLQMNVPTNWKEFESQSSVQFAPEGAYGGQGITRGAMVGIYRGQTNSLSRDTQEYVNGLLSGNNYLRQDGPYRNSYVGGREGYTASLSGRSPVTGQTELVTLYTVQLANSDLLYVVTVVPQAESSRYSYAFQNMLRSIRFND